MQMLLPSIAKKLLELVSSEFVLNGYQLHDLSTRLL
jgi:hypothetical protein